MATGAVRDDEELTTGIEAWIRATSPERSDVRVDSLVRPTSGWSSETLVVEWSWADAAGRSRERVVVRLPLVVPSYPSYVLRDQARVLDALGTAGIPAPRVLAIEDDDRFLGSPFLVMSFVDGRPVGEVPALDRRLLDAPADVQRRVQEGFLGALACAHRVDWKATGLGDTLRVGVPAEIAYWTEYVDWAADGAPARVLADALTWCAQTAPAVDTAPSLLWGDARLGNVMFDDGGHVVALLDWELATIGPAEMDIAWYLVLDDLVTGFVGRTVPGFLDRDATLRFYERALGRPVEHLAWHEIFALARSIAINDRQARLAAAAGTKYPGVAGDANPVLAYLNDRITAFVA